MATLFNGRTVSFRFYGDVDRFERHEGVGNNVRRIAEAVTANLARFGTCGRVVLEARRNFIADDVVSGVVTFTPNRDMQTAELDTQLLESMNWFALDGIRAGRCLPIFRHSTGMLAFWGPGIVIDPASIVHGGSEESPNSSASVLGRVTSALSTVASTDERRDGRNVVNAAVQTMPEDLIPPWIRTMVIAGAVLGGALVASIAVANVAKAVK